MRGWILLASGVPGSLSRIDQRQQSPVNLIDYQDIHRHIKRFAPGFCCHGYGVLADGFRKSNIWRECYERWVVNELGCEPTKATVEAIVGGEI